MSKQQKNKKPFYKRVWVWVIAAIFIIAVAGGGEDETPAETAPKPTLEELQETQDFIDDTRKLLEDAKADAESVEPVEEPAKVEPKPSVPVEHKSALKKAETYAKTMKMSKKAIYGQLTSEYGEKFSKEAADYAMANIEHDWKANALAKAKTYQDTMAMSPSAIKDQLTSEYGEQFTQEEANYAIENLDK